LGIDIEILPYKGHLIISNKKIGLNGILIVNDRIAVEGKNLYLNGDSKLDNSIDVNYEEIYRTINEIGKIIRVDTSALEIRVGFRSVSKDGEPIVRNIFSNAILVTGYRFGFALAPILAHKAIDLIKS
ncbi:FAD-binding oxidoreductase, partial [Sulfolobus sp. E3]